MSFKTANTGICIGMYPMTKTLSYIQATKIYCKYIVSPRIHLTIIRAIKLTTYTVLGKRNEIYTSEG